MYASWTTVYCPDCKGLSDATISSEDIEALAEYRKHSITLPDNIACPDCKTTRLRAFQQHTCPRCGREKTVLNKGSYFKAMLVCEPCGTSVSERDSDQRFFVYPSDEVSVRLYCEACDTYPLLKVHIPGAYVPPPEWKEHELKCGKCDSQNVEPWSSGQPCPACGGNIRRSDEPLAFTD
jgi:ssDNA-binding Zn-finger/Zn-ribbon topoisomerase 1